MEDSKSSEVEWKREGVDDTQRLVGGNFPWDNESDLEKETNKEMEPKVTTAINEVLNKINQGPIYLEEEAPHPYFKPTLNTLYAKRASQVVIETAVIIPIHLVESIADDVQSVLKSNKYTFATPIRVVYEEADRAGVMNEKNSGYVKEYRFKEFTPNSGSVSAIIEGVITWNK